MQHVVVIGSGLIGAAAAHHLARAGARVTVIEAGTMASGASSRSFGWINASFYLDPAHHHLRVAGIAAHRALSAVHGDLYHWTGCLWHESFGAEQAAFAARLRALGYPVTELTRADTARRIPALTDPTEALFLPAEGAVEADALARALLAASGAEVWSGLPVQALATAGDRVTGVVTAAGHVGADHVVLAAGTGTPALLAPLGIALPLLPRPGALVTTRPIAPILPHILCGPEGELRQRPCGRLILPAAPAHQSDDRAVLDELPGTLARQALDRLRRRLPEAIGAALAVERVTLAERPVPADGLPVLGRVLPGLIVAVMHSGVTLGPLAGQAVADLVMDRPISPLWSPYGPDRFQPAP